LKHRSNEYATQRQKADNIAKNEKTKTNKPRRLRNKYPATSYEKKLKHRSNEYATQRQKADNIDKNDKIKAKQPRKLWSWDKPRTINRTYEKTR